MVRVLIGINDSVKCTHFKGKRGIILRHTTYGCEIDIFDNSLLDDILNDVKENSIVFSSSDEHLDRVKRDLDDRSLIEYAFTLFNQERYWEYHEILEKIWRKSDGKTKEFVQCLIHVGVSQVKFQLGQPDTAKIVYYRTMERIKSLFSNDQLHIFPEKFRYPVILDDIQIRTIMENKIMKNII